MLMENKKSKPIVLYHGDETTQDDIMGGFELMGIYKAQDGKC